LPFEVQTFDCVAESSKELTYFFNGELGESSVEQPYEEWIYRQKSREKYSKSAVYAVTIRVKVEVVEIKCSTHPKKQISVTLVVLCKY
jgi:hypothetical protein